MIKFNGELVIPEYKEECTHGVFTNGEVLVHVRRSVGQVVIQQDDDIIDMTEEQAKMLKDFLDTHME